MGYSHLSSSKENEGHPPIQGTGAGVYFMVPNKGPRGGPTRARRLAQQKLKGGAQLFPKEFRGMQWNSIEFYRILWNLMECNGIDWNLIKINRIQWNSIEFNAILGIPWNSMEFTGLQ